MLSDVLILCHEAIRTDMTDDIADRLGRNVRQLSNREISPKSRWPSFGTAAGDLVERGIGRREPDAGRAAQGRRRASGVTRGDRRPGPRGSQALPERDAADPIAWGRPRELALARQHSGHAHRADRAPSRRALIGIPHTPGTREYLTCELGEIEFVASGQSIRVAAGDVVVFRAISDTPTRTSGRAPRSAIRS